MRASIIIGIFLVGTAAGISLWTNPCDDKPCKNGGTCKDDGYGSSLGCTCVPGFTGEHCQTNIDDCVGVNCFCGKCVDGVNSFTCTDCEKECGKPGKSSSTIRTPLIIGGSDATEGEFPWQLALERKDGNGKFQHGCAAVLLCNKWALTACHCVLGGKNDVPKIRIVAGQHKRSDAANTKQILEVKDIEHHPKCNFPAYDYALIELKTAADLSKPDIGTICLPKKDAKYDGNKNCWISGWGRISGMPTNDTLADTLQKAKMNVLTNAVCKNTLKNLADIEDYHVCVKSDNNDMSACHKDSGGPLQCLNKDKSYELVGVTSFGRIDCLTSFPGVYADVPHVVDWIKTTTKIAK